MKIVVFTGAGISAESGISTFRDANGLWEGHDVMEVASPQGFSNNPHLVLDFYNQRRAQLFKVHPNPAHHAIAKLEEEHEVVVVTQNVDDLHERAGSKNVIHLHGELRKIRSTGDPSYIQSFDGDVVLGQKCPNGFQMRPHIVWFGESVPMLEKAAAEFVGADTLIVVGTSLQVYPAAGLIQFAPPHCECFYIDPNPQISYELSIRPHRVIEKKAGVGLPILVKSLLDNSKDDPA